MDIHRCRFIPYPASSINALSFSHTTKPNQKTPHSLRLALGRANGDIEIWNPAKGVWSQEIVFRGGKNRSVEGLVWTQDLDSESESKTIPGDLRLFSIGYSNSVTEWNLSNGLPLRHSTGNHAEIWSLAVQPRWNKNDGLGERSEQLLAVGCADGSIVLHSTADGQLTFVKVLRRAANLKARILSLCFCDRNTVAAGCSDGTILIYDIRGKGKIRSILHLGAGSGKTSTYVWIVKYLSSNVLVSGDSAGELKFWDLKTFTITQRLLCHDGDILTLASNSEGTLFFSGGMDRKICLISKDKSTSRWREIYHQKIHAGQVKAMASIETKDLSLVISGGIDPSPVLLPLGSTGRENIRTLPGLPQSPPLLSAPDDRLLVSWWDREVVFCELNNELLRSISMQTATNEELESLQRILIQGEENISSVSVSRNGKLLAIATNTGCKIFVLSRRKDGTSTRKIRRLECESLSNYGAKQAIFSPDGQWLVLIHPNNDVKVHQILVDDSSKTGFRADARSISLERPHKHVSPNDPLQSYQRNISKVAWSDDSKMIVCGDIAGNLDVWIHEETKLQPNGVPGVAMSTTNGHTNGKLHESDSSDESEEEHMVDSSQDKNTPWRLIRQKLPKLPSSPLLLTFRSTKNSTRPINDGATNKETEDRLIAITLRHEVLEFHAFTGRLTDWSKRNPSSNFPLEFLQIRDRVMGGVWDNNSSRERLWLYGSSFLFMLNMNKDLKDNTVTQPGQSLKRKRSDKSNGASALLKRTSGAGDLLKNSDDFGLTTTEDDTLTDKASKDVNTADEESDEDYEDSTAIWKGFVDDKSTQSGQTEHSGDENLKTTNNKDDTANPDEHTRSMHTELSWWYTHKYRPILGLVPLSQMGESAYDDEEGSAMTSGLEVALVERTLWDLDLDLPFL